jgi:hypothetical protein
MVVWEPRPRGDAALISTCKGAVADSRAPSTDAP